MTKPATLLHPRFEIACFALVGALLCCSASAVEDTGRSEVTILRGCLRTMGDRVFILVGENYRGYLLNGDQKTFSRHVDQEIEVAGTLSSPEPVTTNHFPLEIQIFAGSKKGPSLETSSLGLTSLQVSSLTPLLASCVNLSAVHR